MKGVRIVFEIQRKRKEQHAVQQLNRIFEGIDNHYPHGQKGQQQKQSQDYLIDYGARRDLSLIFFHCQFRSSVLKQRLMINEQRSITNNIVTPIAQALPYSLASNAVLYINNPGTYEE